MPTNDLPKTTGELYSLPHVDHQSKAVSLGYFVNPTWISSRKWMRPSCREKQEYQLFQQTLQNVYVQVSKLSSSRRNYNCCLSGAKEEVVRYCYRVHEVYQQ